MDEEVAILRSRMEAVCSEKSGKFEYLTGRLAGKEIVLLKCGVGKVNAGAGCAILLDRYHPGLVINTGCAGGINSESDAIKLNFGDVVLGSNLVQHDVDVCGLGYPAGRIPGHERYFEASPAILDRAEAVIKELKTEGALPQTMKQVRGLIGSGDVFMCEAARIKAVAALFPGLRAVEMEGAAIAHVCSLFNVPCLVIRALSDIAGEESPVTYTEYLPVAAQHSSEIVTRLA
jgi:adenosylhomocysteine nucleosidase